MNGIGSLTTFGLTLTPLNRFDGALFRDCLFIDCLRHVHTPLILGDTNLLNAGSRKVDPATCPRFLKPSATSTPALSHTPPQSHTPHPHAASRRCPDRSTTRARSACPPQPCRRTQSRSQSAANTPSPPRRHDATTPTSPHRQHSTLH